MKFDASASKGLGADHVYSTKHASKDTADHFADGGMALAADADAHQPFYGSKSAGKDTEDHFSGMTIGDDKVAHARRGVEISSLASLPSETPKAAASRPPPSTAHSSISKASSAVSFEFASDLDLHSGVGFYPATGKEKRLSDEEVGERRQAVLKVVQSVGLPNLVQKCRSGNPSEMEEGARMLEFLAASDPQCKSCIVAAGALPPLVEMLHADDGVGDDDPTIDMKEQAVKTIHALCVGSPGNQRPVAERGAIPPMLGFLREPHHPNSVKEAAADALALLASETFGGPAQEVITVSGGVPILADCARSAETTPRTKESVARALRSLAVYKPAKKQMVELGILTPREQDPTIAHRPIDAFGDM